MASDEIYFESVKEDRGWYFVEYSPPIPNYRFSTLQLSCIEPRDAGTVAAAIEAEATAWLARYPVPLMATAFAPDSSVLSLNGVRPIDHLIAWLELPDPQPILRWDLVANEVLPDIALNRDFLRKTFADIPSKTERDIHEEGNKYVTQLRVGWWLVFVWAVVVPLGVAVLERWSDLLGLVVLAYAFVKAAIGALRLTGRLPKSRREREKEAEEVKMRHHHYHCERNPEAFDRLKAENFHRWEIERTHAEAAALKANQHTGPVDG